MNGDVDRPAPAQGRPRWTLLDILRGKPVGAPTHAMFVHYPIAFYTGALGLDLLSKFGTFPSAPLAATWLILGAFLGTAAAVTFGLLDYVTMRSGSTIKRVATRHALTQVTAAVLFIVNFAIRWGDRHLAEAKPLWIVLDVVGVGLVGLGAYLGGKMVYEMGYRVGERP
jgi:uncharacterized membrane protein